MGYTLIIKPLRLPGNLSLNDLLVTKRELLKPIHENSQNQFVKINQSVFTRVTKEECQTYFMNFFWLDGSYRGLPKWVVEEFFPENLKLILTSLLITLGCVKAVLRKWCSKSAPGEDEIMHHHMNKSSSTHHSLATLFNKILLSMCESPKVWCYARITLIYKKGDLSAPSNFHPIVLTSSIRKPYHKILARRLEAYLVVKGIAVTSLQKVFLSEITGVMEHVLSKKPCFSV